MVYMCWKFVYFFFFQAEDGIRDAQESRGLGDVYKRQCVECGEETEYVFALLSDVRLCERCEKAHSKYNLISLALARQEYGLGTEQLRGLEWIEGPRGYGRLYLRSHVERLRNLGSPRRTQPKQRLSLIHI
eukprot:TRINITY_DN57986_c0_g1_i1.p2 TRINITY_DN57986_c0_g1~~TRINITY_DN57986_c0_g1_i1.p2  ORF type:complete len:131 (+),score=31.90 TRINITY_DN57986_c0_g1_i1:63-455(+)